jgi:hypothetical protein
MCVVTDISDLVLVVAAPPLAFDLAMLLVICWNSVDRPRAATIPLRAVLVRDGALSFLVRMISWCCLFELTSADVQLITLIRASQLGLSVTGDPALTLLGFNLLPITCSVSTAFNLRFLARLRGAASENDSSASSSPVHPNLSRMNPFKVQVFGEEQTRTRWAGESIELGRIEVELRKD